MCQLLVDCGASTTSVDYNGDTPGDVGRWMNWDLGPMLPAKSDPTELTRTQRAQSIQRINFAPNRQRGRGEHVLPSARGQLAHLGDMEKICQLANMLDPWQQLSAAMELM